MWIVVRVSVAISRKICPVNLLYLSIPVQCVYTKNGPRRSLFEITITGPTGTPPMSGSGRGDDG